jgi:hypothetical protein
MLSKIKLSVGTARYRAQFKALMSWEVTRALRRENGGRHICRSRIRPYSKLVLIPTTTHHQTVSDHRSREQKVQTGDIYLSACLLIPSYENRLTTSEVFFYLEVWFQ